MGQWSVHVSRGDKLSTHTSTGQEAWWAACRPNRGPGHVVYVSRAVSGTSPGGAAGTGPQSQTAGNGSSSSGSSDEQQLAHAFPQPFPATPTQILCRSSGSNFVSKLHKIKVHA